MLQTISNLNCVTRHNYQFIAYFSRQPPAARRSAAAVSGYVAGDEHPGHVAPLPPARASTGGLEDARARFETRVAPSAGAAADSSRIPSRYRQRARSEPNGAGSTCAAHG
jgi:hypothetical protein